MSALANAMARAECGLDWSYPCLIWVADYLCEATGRDPAESWRHIDWNEAKARGSLARLSVAGEGETVVERALDAIARRDGWEAADGPRQGAVMVGVFSVAGLPPVQTDRSAGPDCELVGVPAIFDGSRRWIVSNDGRGWTSIGEKPGRMWEVRA